MDLRDLRYFETIAELQHVGRASEKLHRTQPAITLSIRRLENDIGAPLIEKMGRGIKLTEAGQILLKWARRMRFDEEDARRELGAIGKGLTGDVRLGIVPTAAQFLLPAAAGQLMIEAPEVTLRTVVGLVDTLKPLLRSGELDLVVGTQAAREDDYTSRLIAEDVIVVAASAKHELLQRQVTLNDLVGYRWALQPQGASLRDWLDHAFDRKRLPRPRVQVESTMLILLPALVEQSNLLSFISRQHIQGREALKELPLAETTMYRRLMAMHRKNNDLSPACERLLELLSSAGSRR
jgi:DNA-binding transcriptional LysR family regulator